MAYTWNRGRYEIRVLRQRTSDPTVPTPGFPALAPLLAEQLYEPSLEHVPECKRGESGV